MPLPTDLPTDLVADITPGHTAGHNTANGRVNDIATAVNTLDALFTADTPTPREVLFDSKYYTDGTTIVLTTGSGTEAGDLLVLLHNEDYATLADMPIPTGGSGDWALLTTADNGTNKNHLKVWTSTVVTPGAQAVTVHQNAADPGEYYGLLYVLPAGTVLEDYAVTATLSVAANPLAPSVTAEGDNRLLVCAWFSEWEPAGAVSYAAPGSMTGSPGESVPGTGGNNSYGLTARQDVDAGATGTRAATGTGTSKGYTSISLLFRTANELDTIAEDATRRVLAEVPSLEDLEAGRTVGAVSATATHLLGVAQTDQRIGAFALANTATATADDTNYWTVALKRYRAGSASTIATRTTQTAGPNGTITANTGWTFDLVSFGSAQYLLAGDVLAVTFTASGSPTALAGTVVSWRYEPGVTA